MPLGLNLGAVPGRCRSRLRLAPPLPHTSGLSSSEAAAEGWTRGGRTDRQTDRQTVTALQARRRTPVAEPAAAAGSVFSWGSYSKYLKLIKRLKCSHAGDSFGAFLPLGHFCLSRGAGRDLTPKPFSARSSAGLGAHLWVWPCLGVPKPHFALLCFAAPSPALPHGEPPALPHIPAAPQRPLPQRTMSPRTRTHTGTMVGTACLSHHLLPGVLPPCPRTRDAQTTNSPVFSINKVQRNPNFRKR